MNYFKLLTLLVEYFKSRRVKIGDSNNLSIKADSKAIMDYKEPQVFLKNSEYGKLAEVSDKIPLEVFGIRQLRIMSRGKIKNFMRMKKHKLIQQLNSYNS